MERIVIDKPGGYDRLRLERSPDPRPGPGEVLIAVEAVGVNYADCITRMGLYASAKQLVGYPICPGFEVAGRVAALGEGVEGLSFNQPVMGMMVFGAYASHVVLRRQQVFPIPVGLSVPQAAAFPAVHLTAWYGLLELAHPRPGERVLVHSAAGGVGSALVQIAKDAGCEVVGVVGAPHKKRVPRDLGADTVIDRSDEPLWEMVEAIAPAGVDVILDANGVATLAESYAHLAPTGRLVVYGFHTMLPRGRGRSNPLSLVWNWLRTPRFDPLRMTHENRSVLAFNLSFLGQRLDLLGRGMAWLIEAVEAGRLAAPAVTEYPFAEVADAHRALESGETTGKLVLRLD